MKLNELLEDFYITVKKTDGSGFLATSLHAIRWGLDWILKNAGAGFSVTSSTFSSSTRELKEKLKVLSKTGMSGVHSCNVVYFSLSDEEEMWRTGCLGDDSPVALLSMVVKYNSQYLSMRTLQEHMDLTFGDIELLKDSQNRPFVARTDSVKQENRVNVKRARYGQIYHEHSNGHKLCPYCLLYKYLYIHRTPSQMEAKSPFYLTAQKEVCGMGSVWYEEQRMGLRSLRGVVPKLANKVKLEHCENFTFVSFTQASRKFVPLSPCQQLCPLSALTSQCPRKVLHPVALVWCEEGEPLSNKSKKWKDRTLNSSWGGLHVVRSHLGDEYSLVLKTRGAVVSFTIAQSPEQRGGGELFPHWRQQCACVSWTFLLSKHS